MKNPYDDILPPETVHVGRSTAWLVSIVFLLGILIPPLYRNFAEAASGNENAWIPVREFGAVLKPEEASAGGGQLGIAARLKEFDTRLQDNANFGISLRRTTQDRLTAWFDEGNNRTVIGDDGWLFFRPAIHALTGYGPVKREPESVAKDPSRPSWRPALGAITKFGEQLRERGLELVLVPAPVKPMIYPERLAEGVPFDAPVRHRDAGAFYDAIRASGIDVVDLAQLLWEMKAEDGAKGEVFLKQDTHWRPRAVTAAAREVAEHLRQKSWFGELAAEESFEVEVVKATHIGDLVEKLDFTEPERFFQPEVVTLQRILKAGTGEPVRSDDTSPICLLGDSFVNVFDDPSLGFAGDDKEESVSAGFAQHLARELGQTLDVIAINGEASTGVREQFALKFDDHVRAKKAVVWLIAERDLFLSETPARGMVEWGDVRFNPNQAPSVTVVAEGSGATAKGKVVLGSKIENPREVVYQDALYVIEMDIEEVSDGSLPEDQVSGDPILVVLWAFKGKKYLPEASIKEGQTVNLKLVPWDSRKDLHTINLSNDSMSDAVFFPDKWWFGELVN